LDPAVVLLMEESVVSLGFRCGVISFSTYSAMHAILQRSLGHFPVSANEEHWLDSLMFSHMDASSMEGHVLGLYGP
jgi:hypothetical protein